MPLENEWIEYAAFALLVALVRLVHPVFIIPLILYTVYRERRITTWHKGVLVVIMICLCRPLSEITLEATLKGRVIKICPQYVLLKNRQGIIKAYTDEKLTYGDEIISSYVKLSVNEADNTHGFDERRYMKANGIIGKVKLTKIREIKPHMTLTRLIASSIDEESSPASYQKLFLLGIRDEDMSDDYQQMTDLSILHLFALSGMHLTLLSGLLKVLYERLFSRQTSDDLALVTLGFYVFSIPPSYSLKRAFLMMLLPKLFHHSYSRIDYLAMVFLGYLLLNPYVIFSTSFVFSFGVYLLVILSREMKYPGLIIYLGSIPMIIHVNYTFSPVSWLVCLLLTPFIEIFYVTAVLSILIKPLTEVLKLFIILFRNTLDFLTLFHFQFTFSYPPLAFTVLYYTFFLALCVALEHHQSIRRLIMLLIALLISFHYYSVYKIYSDVTMINVGQGDCTLIRLAMNRYNILIDTGGNRRYDLATHTLIPYLKSIGIDHLDAVYISHYDYDHYGALESLQQHFRVDHVIDSPQTPLTIGPLTIENLTTDHNYSDKNDNSNILYVTLNNVHYLFTGDLGSQGEYDLLQKYHSLDVDVLKVAHHGSSGSSSVALFELIHPKIAMIGVGKNNLYGHPSDIVLERLKQRGIMILRTDQDGDFTIRHYGRDYYVLIGAA